MRCTSSIKGFISFDEVGSWVIAIRRFKQINVMQAWRELDLPTYLVLKLYSRICTSIAVINLFYELHVLAQTNVRVF